MFYSAKFYIPPLRHKIKEKGCEQCLEPTRRELCFSENICLTEEQQSGQQRMPSGSQNRQYIKTLRNTCPSCHPRFTARSGACWKKTRNSAISGAVLPQSISMRWHQINRITPHNYGKRHIYFCIRHLQTMHVAVSAEQYGFDRLPALKRRSLFLCIFLRRRGGDTLAAALLSLCLCFSLQHAKSYLCDACFDGIDKSVQMLYNTNEHRSFF